MDAVKKKIEDEYELFCLDMMRTSRMNIFTKSREIEMKKRIAFSLKKNLKSVQDKEKREKILIQENLIDSVFRKACEYEALNEMNAEKFVQSWINANL